MRSAKITVVIPAYNHAAYLADTIGSVLQQDWPDLVLDILDDGSQDDTALVAEKAVSKAGNVKCTVERQENQGSSRTLNRLIERSDCDFVAILNSDDLYAPGRLHAFAQRAESDPLFFGFSGIEFLESDGSTDLTTFEEWYSSKLEVFTRLPTCGFAQLTGNLSVTSSNFFFSREVFDLVGGFDPTLQLTQDWDFSIKALRWVDPVFLPDRLMTYRIHPENTWRRLVDVRREQCEQVLKNYAGWATDIVPNRLAPVPQYWPRFFPFFARVCGSLFSSEPIGFSLPDSLLQSSGNPNSIVSYDDAALRDLMSPSPDTGGRQLLSQIADHWDSVRAAHDDTSRILKSALKVG